MLAKLTVVMALIAIGHAAESSSASNTENEALAREYKAIRDQIIQTMDRHEQLNPLRMASFPYLSDNQVAQEAPEKLKERTQSDKRFLRQLQADIDQVLADPATLSTLLTARIRERCRAK